jgi:hypothetical protein
LSIAQNWSRENLAWAAGLFEGEGCIAIKPGTVQLQLGMSDEDVVRRFWKVVGMGKVYGPYQDKRKATHKLMWTWSVSGSQMSQALLAAMWSFLGARRRGRAAEAIASCAARRPKLSEKRSCLRGHPLDEANIYRLGGRRICKECLRSRNRERKKNNKKGLSECPSVTIQN